VTDQLMSRGSEFDKLLGAPRDQIVGFLQRARNDEPVFYSPEFDVYVVTRYEDVKVVLDDLDSFSRAGTGEFGAMGMPDEVIAVLATGPAYPHPPRIGNVDGAEQLRLRRSILKGFTSRAVAKMEPEIRRYANELLDVMEQDLARNGAVDFVQSYAYPLPLNAIFAFFGAPPEDKDNVLKWAQSWFALGWLPQTLEDQIACAHDIVEFRRWCSALIDSRQASPREDDFLTALIQDGVLTKDELILLCEFLFEAGHASTAAFISHTIHNLLLRPKTWAALCVDLTLSSKVVEEGLRYDPPVRGFYRGVKRDITLGGVDIPAGSRVLYSPLSANHDEAVFPRGSDFDLDRENANQHMTFSAGISHCVGAGLARLEGKVSFEEIARRLPNLTLVPDQFLMHYPSIALHTLVGLLVTTA
jgi:cytochrome P450